MDLFDSLFWMVLAVSAGAGFLNFIIRFTRNIIEDEKITFKKSLAWFVHDTLIGLAAGFGTWLVNSAMNNENGILLIGFISGLTGVTALNQLRRLTGMRDDLQVERDKLLARFEKEIDIIESLTKQLNATKKALNDAQRRLRLMENKSELDIDDIMRENDDTTIIDKVEERKDNDSNGE